MSDLKRLEVREDILYNTLVVDAKDILISSLREWFSHDSIFTYKSDEFGYPLIPQTDLRGGGLAGSQDIVWGTNSTKIIITDDYRFNSRFFPAITVTDNGGNNSEVSFNQEMGGVKYQLEEVVLDGQIVQRRVPSHIIFAGAWKQNYAINVIAEDHQTRKRLKDIVSMLFVHVLRETLLNRGIFIEKVGLGGDREDQFANDYYYSSSINLDLYSEWRREVPVTLLVEAIMVQSNLLSAALSPQDLQIVRDCVSKHPMAAFYSSQQSDGAVNNIVPGCSHADLHIFPKPNDCKKK